MNFLSFLFNDSVLCLFKNINIYSTFVNLNSFIFVLHVLNIHEMYAFKLCRRWMSHMSPVHYEHDKLLAVGVCRSEKQVM